MMAPVERQLCCDWWLQWMCTHPAPLYSHTHFIAALRAALVLYARQTVSAAPALTAVALLQDLHHTRLMDGVQTLAHTQINITTWSIMGEMSRAQTMVISIIIANEVQEHLQNDSRSCSGIHRKAGRKDARESTWNVIYKHVLLSKWVRFVSHLFAGSHGALLQCLRRLHLALSAVQSAQIPQGRIDRRTADKTTVVSQCKSSYNRLHFTVDYRFLYFAFDCFFRIFTQSSSSLVKYTVLACCPVLHANLAATQVKHVYKTSLINPIILTELLLFWLHNIRRTHFYHFLAQERVGVCDTFPAAKRCLDVLQSAVKTLSNITNAHFN